MAKYKQREMVWERNKTLGAFAELSTVKERDEDERAKEKRQGEGRGAASILCRRERRTRKKCLFNVMF
jgi:hypothetical protein